MSKIGISTVDTGFNYGSALQSYATKVILSEQGYEGVNISIKGSLVKGRDVRVKKMLVMFLRLIVDVKSIRKKLDGYISSVKKEYPEETKKMFEDFREHYVQPQYFSWTEINKTAKSDDFKAFLCGSDQIWSAQALYVDPQYYLRYAPKEKRIAFAPSFGNDKVADYNKKIIAKYVSDIPNLSVREASGVGIIKNLTNRRALHLIDPTLLLDKDKWNKCLGIVDKKTDSNGYILAYFLSEPSDYAKEYIIGLSKRTGLKIVALPYSREKSDWFSETPCAGPIEFVELINKAKYVCTDSFHGTAFSVIYQVPFFTFDRQYGSSQSQSTRVTSFLELLGLSSRFNPTMEDIDITIDFNRSKEILENERNKSISYLLNSLENVGGSINGK